MMQLGHAMMNDQKKNDRDRELFSELIEPPIRSNLIQEVPLFLEERNPMYIVHMFIFFFTRMREKLIGKTFIEIGSGPVS